MIAVECFPDEVLLRALGVPIAKIVHGRGRGNVLNELLQGRVRAVVIDEDPNGGSIPQLTSFVTSERVGSVVLMTGRSDPGRRVIVICPRLEEWLIHRASVVGIAPGSYGLPDTGRALHRLRRYDMKPKYADFLCALLRGDPEMQTVKKWLSMGKTHAHA